MDDDLTITESRDGSTVIVAAAGEIDLSNVGDLRDAVTSACRGLRPPPARSERDRVHRQHRPRRPARAAQHAPITQRHARDRRRRRSGAPGGGDHRPRGVARRTWVDELAMRGAQTPPRVGRRHPLPARQPRRDRGDPDRRLLRAALGRDRGGRARHARARRDRGQAGRGRGARRRRAHRRPEGAAPTRRRRPGPDPGRVGRAREAVGAGRHDPLLGRAAAHRRSGSRWARRRRSCSRRAARTPSSAT